MTPPTATTEGAGTPDAPDADWAAAFSYLPPVLLRTAQLKPHLSPPWIEPLEGTLVFADISGFTAMSERLTEMGREGAELLTNIINRYFSRILEIAQAHGGTNVKFGGDALLLLFTGERHANHAVATAHRIEAATRRFPAVRVGRDRIRLSMHVGVHSGALWSAAAGMPGRRMQHFILGSQASRVAEVESAAGAEVLVSPDTHRILDPLGRVEPAGPYYRILEAAQSRSRAVSETPPAPPTEQTREELLAYLPPPVLHRLRSRQAEAGVEGEHRKVSVMFVHLVGVNELLEQDGPSALLSQLQQYLSLVLDSAERYGGFLLGNDISALGIKLILVFGAPLAHEQDAANALRLGLELARGLPRMGLALRHQIGIHSGFVFAGEVGSPLRRDYTVMGDAVNLAARLMGAAPAGQVLISRAIGQEAGPGFILKEMAPIQVKGKKAPV
ncbi:MAG: adenylate/guanylate cyclase domain-containing protein, partial [Chloroflexota bacterium]|nr:adenylate/guanylate cyclase domain-containing protein [Chloroflexota bacterium]